MGRNNKEQNVEFHLGIAALLLKSSLIYLK